MASTYELIETTTLASSASSVSFTSITQDYRDLVLVCNTKSSDGNARVLQAKFNGDTGANYNQVYMQATSSSADTRSILWIGIAGGTSDAFPITKLDILDYSATDKHKSSLGVYQNTPNVVRRYANRWANTSAITSIEIVVSGADIAADSILSLYGVAS